MRPQDLPEIRALPLFAGLAEDHFEELMRGAHAQGFPEGVELIRQGDPPDFLHVVLDGIVELFARWEGREATMGLVRPLETFILAACVRDVPHLMSARTLGRSRLVLIPAEGLRALLGRDPSLAGAMLRELAGGYREVVRQAKGLKLRDSRERIAAYLLSQSARAGGAASFPLPVEKRVLASLLGMTAENLSRALRALEGDGVKVDGARVILTDRTRLAALARPDTLIDGPDLEGPGTKPA